ncbi:SpoIIE family protein phosphatase [Paenibacillus camelliae]|uniref:SpoIIE family protein phosphatase n=1 Tax=Paenibacillus camelliae TaxID=512410 RepID=UPI0020422103|nr:SpoIIE family protein phosphatase [Paenibacillus camelliae]MCM3634908.1 serine/threonine-protein phosphatase [Paenibacillus camelliae]
MKEHSMHQSLAVKCYAMYGGIGFIVVAGMLFSNEFVSYGSTEQFQRTLFGVGIGYVLLLTFLILYTHIRLTRAAKLAKKDTAEMEANDVWLHFTSLPSEVFWVYALAGLTIAQTYRLYTAGLPPWPEKELMQFWKGLFLDLSTFVAFAIIHAIMLKWILLQEVKRLHFVQMLQPRIYNVVNRIKFIVIGILLFMLISVFWHNYEGIEQGVAPNWPVLIASSSIIITMAIAAVYVASSYLMGDLNRMRVNLYRLDIKNADTLSPCPIVSPYEAGQQTVTFNHLQDQQLFPDKQLSFDGWTIKGQSHELQGGTTFFHIYDEQARRIVMLGGSLSGNKLPAAIVMSAILKMFRAYAEEYYASDAILYRLKQQLAGALKDDMLLHVGVISIDLDQAELEWGLLGQVRCMVVDDEGSTSYAAGSNPIGSSIMSSFSYGCQPLHAVQQLQLQVDVRESQDNFSTYTKNNVITWLPLLTVCRMEEEA